MRGMEATQATDALAGDFVSLLLYAALIFFIIYSFIIVYHWMRWCSSYSMKVWSLAVYFSGSFILLAILFGAYIAL